MSVTREEVFKHFVGLLPQVSKEWDPDEEITDQTHLLGDMNWRSIEVIMLAHQTQEHYGTAFPFNDFFSRSAEKKVRDLTVGEWVEFVHSLLGGGNGVSPQVVIHASAPGGNTHVS